MVQKKHHRDTRLYKKTYYTPMKNLIEERKKDTDALRKEFASMFPPLGENDPIINWVLLKLKESDAETTRLMIEEFKKSAKYEMEKMYPEFLDRNCNDLLVILSGRILQSLTKLS